jgi:ubiquitin-protein ligase
VIEKGLPGFLEPDEFERKHPGTPPEKYLVIYGCTGLMRKPDGEIAETAMHAMEVIFGWDYPSKAPTFIWHTPIWHPNFNPPHICIQGRPFAIGLTLDTIVLEVGRMIQYQNYNVDDAMNHEAEDWARHNPRRFPVDDRDLLDGRVKLSARRKASLEDELVQIVVPDKVDMKSDQLIELTGIHFDASQLKHKPN